jgi:hypothetical protein
VLLICDQEATERVEEIIRVGEVKLVREGEDTRINQLL